MPAKVTKLVLATRNPGKVREMKELLGDLAVEITSLDGYPAVPVPEEDGTTFEDNALKKARLVIRYVNLPVLADDSGLEVEKLGNRPGIHSARYAGQHATDMENNIKLLSELMGTDMQDRKARYRCVLAFVLPSGEEYTFEGTCEGLIGQEMKGSGGFGYDSLFYIPSLKKTMAELPPEKKNAISHRGAALAKFRKKLRELNTNN